MFFRLHKDGITIDIRLTPGARADALHGIADAADGKKVLKAGVTAPPEDGKANRALIALLSKAWKLPKSSFTLLNGETSRNKTVLVAGDGAALLEKLSALYPAE